MAEMQYSPLLARVMEKAEQLAKENHVSGVSREYVVAAAMEVVREGDAGSSAEAERLRKLLPAQWKADARESLLQVWRDRSISMTERLMMLAVKQKARNRAEAEGNELLSADHFLASVLENSTRTIEEAVGKGQTPEPEGPVTPEPEPLAAPEPAADPDVPDWMARFRASSAGGAASSGGDASAPQQPSATPDQPASTAASEVGGWLAAFRKSQAAQQSGEQAPAAPAEQSPADEQPAVPETPAVPEQPAVPETLAAPETTTPPVTTGQAAEPQQTQVPDWMAMFRKSQGQQQEQQAQQEPAPKMTMAEMVQKTKQLQAELSEVVMGQANAVSVFCAGYFQAELQASLQENRDKPKATFLFAGPPGVGKTFLSEQAAKRLDFPYRRFDMSEYSNPNAVDELAGSDANYKAAAEGLLTGFVAKNPRCVILFDEIEKASIDAIHLFLQILDAGRLRDNKTDQEVSFQDAILIFTTNAGKELYEDSDKRDLSCHSRQVILDALARDVNPKTKEPLFPGAICSRFASGNVVMFNHLEAHTLHGIVGRQLNKHLTALEKEMGVKSELSTDVVTALLLAEGADADARTVKSRADAFFGTELYELYRMATSEKCDVKTEAIKNVRFTIDLPETGDIRSLFHSLEPVEALVCTQKPFTPPDLPGECTFTLVADFAQAEEAFRKHDFRLVLCDVDGKSGQNSYLNQEDVASAGRSFLMNALEKFPALPVFLLERTEDDYTDEEKGSYLKRGVRGFVRVDDVDAFRRVLTVIHQQHSLVQLARSNRLLTFETAQRILPDGETASIVLFDLKLNRAVRADDQANILSGLSRPKTRFQDVIGAKDAKDELKQFVKFLQNPRKYMGTGVSAPKGILLYGPPGTGKTMLAKALAGEADVTFIAAQGNQFLGKYVGDGQRLAHKLFATARRYAPSVLFIDEIDSFGKARTGSEFGTAQVAEDALTAFLAEMDGFDTDPTRPVFVMGATNYGVDQSSAMRLDDAFLRRFDRQIYIDLPDKADRALFLTQKTGANPRFRVSEAMIKALSERSTGMSLAKLNAVLELALRTALREEQEYVDDAGLDEAFETYNSGEEHTWDEATVLRTARHEAGHTLLSYLSGEKPSYVTIVSRGSHGGYMQHEDSEARMGYTRKELLARIRTSLAGRAAELVCYGPEDGVTTGASSDLRSATAYAKHMLCTYGMDADFGYAALDDKAMQALQGDVYRKVNGILREQMQETVALIERNRAALDALVAALLEKNHLNGADIDKLLAGVV